MEKEPFYLKYARDKVSVLEVVMNTMLNKNIDIYTLVEYLQDLTYDLKQEIRKNEE